MADIIIRSVMDIYLIGIATVLTLITAIRYFGLAKRKENPEEKSIVNAFALLSFFLTIYLILVTLSFFYLETKYDNYLYRGNFNNPSLIHVWITKVGLISYFSGFIYYYYIYEKILNKRIHLATFACILIIILTIFLPYKLFIYQFIPIAWSLITLYFAHTLITLMKKSERELRAATSFILIGSWFIGMFMVLMSPTITQLGDKPILISPILFIFGTFLCMSPTIFKPEFFSRHIKYWYLFSSILIGGSLLIIIFIVTFMIEYFIIGLAILLFIVVECVFLIRFIKREESLGFKSDIKVRGIFTKPEKVTEEEVSISKEKKICLVCKGKVEGILFMCTDCGAFYCIKCSDAISNLENACWACNEAIDKSKPVKMPEKEEEKVIVQKKKTKK